MSDTFQFPGVPDDDPLGDIDIPSPLTPPGFYLLLGYGRRRKR